MYCVWNFCSAGDQAVVREARDVDKIKLAGNFTVKKVCWNAVNSNTNGP